MNQYVPQCYNGYTADWPYEPDRVKIKCLTKECQAFLLESKEKDEQISVLKRSVSTGDTANE